MDSLDLVHLWKYYTSDNNLAINSMDSCNKLKLHDHHHYFTDEMTDKGVTCIFFSSESPIGICNHSTCGMLLASVLNDLYDIRFGIDFDLLCGAGDIETLDE